MKTEYFKEQINYIKDKKIKEDVSFLINKLPEYFFEIQASTTGKYHPKYAVSKHGLVKHTKVAVEIAKVLIDNETTGGSFSEKEKDLIIMALLLHDGLKCGENNSKHTLFVHPLLMSEFIMKNKESLKMDIDDIRVVCMMIESHMGQWNINPYNKNEKLPKPSNKLTRFVHMCDYLASRKFLNVDFDGNNIIR